MRDLAEHEAAYLAGIIDGEGCLSWYGQKRGRPQPVLQVTNTAVGLMEWLAGITGGYRAATRQSRRKLCYVWRVCSHAEVLAVLERVEPYMQIKGDAASAMILELREREVARV